MNSRVDAPDVSLPAADRTTRKWAWPSERRLRVLLAVLVLAAAVIAIASRMLPSTTPVTSPTLSTKMPPLFDDLEERTFRYFWDTADLNTGLVPDRYPTPSFSSIAAVGFALTAYPIGVERGYITREQARERVLTTLRFFYSAPQGEGASDAAGYKGFFYRFLDMTTGLRSGPIEVSTVDTALLLGGVLFCQSYFDSSNDDETAIRRLADEIYRRVDWRWAQARPPAISHGWTPEGGFIEHDWLGYNEAMLVYILALGSPTHPVDPVAWEEWGRGYEHYWGELYGQPHLTFTPLFGHQYSHVWIDFRGIVDGPMRKAGLDYFENSRRATYAQRAYAIENPMRWAGYGENIWGLTASDGSADVELSFGGEMRRFRTYSARGIGMVYSVDDGTIAPTAAAASLPFAPEIVIPAVEEMHGRYGEYIYGKYGFFDAFNQSFDYDVPLAHGHIVPEFGWVDNDYVGINQGPIVAMIENHRTGLIWRYTKRNPYIRRGLERAGFSGGWLDAPMPKAQSVTGDALFARWKTGCQAGLARTTDDDSREPGPAPSLGLLHACQQAAKSVAAGKGATETS